MTPADLLMRLALAALVFFAALGALAGLAAGVGAMPGALASVIGGAAGVATGVVVRRKLKGEPL